MGGVCAFFIYVIRAKLGETGLQGRYPRPLIANPFNQGRHEATTSRVAIG